MSRIASIVVTPRRNDNPGIVPPWLLPPPVVGPSVPVDDDTPRILELAAQLASDAAARHAQF